MSQETKEKISRANKNKRAGEKHHMYGKKHSEETKLKISKSKKNPSQETRDKIRKSQLVIKKNNNVKILCLTTNEIFDSCRDAGKKYNVDSSSISKCCLGKRRFAGKLNKDKLIWTYIDLNNKEGFLNVTNSKKD